VTNLIRRAVAMTTALVLALAAAAIADGPRTPFVVAHGKSLYGVQWRVRMGEEASRLIGPDGEPGRRARQATLWFSIGDPSESEAGYFSSFPLPVPRSFVFHANKGSEVDEFPESDASGYANRRVAKLVASMSDGTSLTFATQLPPKRLSDRRHWLRRLRFFDQFYPAEVEPVSIAAYDRAGNLLERQPA
jgi:hypothetical protein